MVKKKIFNDPIYGLMHFEYEVLYRIIDHPYFQRLRRISQVAMSHYVYPGAQHSRYQHALGALHLMSKALMLLQNKGIKISEEEKKAACIAILLHDIGHGPFSHALEKLILPLSHEEISLLLIGKMEHDLNEDFSMAKEIYQNRYPKKFLNQLVSSQLDMDRMDYLTRDSFFSGVAEGIIGYDRIITLLTVAEGNLAIEEKGMYSIENFLSARKLMYWQVYLHKAAIGAEQVLVSTVKRCKHLIEQGFDFFQDEDFRDIVLGGGQENGVSLLDKYVKLDDTNILYMLKKGMYSKDKTLSLLSESIIDRKLFSSQLRSEPMPEQEQEIIKSQINQKLDLDYGLMSYFFITKEEKFVEYDTKKDEILFLGKGGKIQMYSEINHEYKDKQAIIKYAVCHLKV
jgi:HD superfamily phosphohydrolase